MKLSDIEIIIKNEHACTGYSIFYENELRITILSTKYYDVVMFKCPVCKRNNIILKFFDDYVLNCEDKEINPGFMSVCEYCFDDIDLLNKFIEKAEALNEI